MSNGSGDLLPFEDPERELEDRLDDLLQYKPHGGWLSVLDSLCEVTELSALQAPVPPVQDDSEAAEATTQSDSPAARYQAAQCVPLRLVRLEVAAAQVEELRLLEPLVLATSFSPELIRELAFAAAHRLRKCGIELLVLPAITLADPEAVPASSYGSDPYLAGRVATALVRGAAGRDRRLGVSLVLNCGTELLTSLPEDHGAGLMAWHERLLEPIAEMVRDGGLRLLLVQQTPAAPKADVDLRAELGEEGLLLVAEAAAPGNLAALADVLSPELLIGAGADRDTVWAALGEREARRRAVRVLRLKLLLGLFDATPAPEVAAVDADRLRARLALASMVQLRNEGVLPLAGRPRVQVLVSHELGPALRDLLSAAFAESNVNARVTQLADGGGSEGRPGGDPEALQAQLDSLTADADLMLWLTPSTVATNRLIQTTLLGSATPLMRVLVGPQTVADIEVCAQASALLQLFGPPETSLRLLPAVLEGARLASGRLAHDAYAPGFRFGAGAAGVAVVYEALTGPTAADTFSVIVLSQTVRNTGQHTLVEVLQLYLRRPDGTSDQLLGFARCALKPGEAARVRLQLDSTLLAQVGPDGVWRVEPGVVALYVGGRIAAPEARLEIELTGEPRALKQQQRVSTLVSIESLGGDEPD